MTYDLRHEPWIACEFLNGTNSMVGFVELFERAHEIRLFYHDNPLAEAALMRILLALSHRILNGPQNKKIWKTHYEKGRYDSEAVQNYFDKWRDRFELFDEKYPFMQVAGLQTTNEKGIKITPTLSSLVHHVASGNNATLFDHTLDSEAPCFPYPDAAMALFVALFYGLGGLQKKGSNLCAYQHSCKNGTGVNGLWAYVQGENLFETLMLNTLILTSTSPIPSTPQDAPFWEKPIANCKETVPKGYLDYLTFTGRLVRLVPEKDGVRYTHFACGRSLKQEIYDPFKPLKVVKNDVKPLSATTEKALWRDSDALFHYGNEGFSVRPLEQLANISRKIANRPYSITVYGLLNEAGKNAKPKSYLKESFPVPLSLLRSPESRIKITEAIKKAEKTGKLLDSAINKFLENSGIKIKDEKEKDQKKRKEFTCKKRSKEIFWSSLHLPFLNLLEHIGEEKTLLQWEKTIQQKAQQAYHAGIRPLVGNNARSVEAYVLGERELYFNKGEKS